jgi:hypothetical protein
VSTEWPNVTALVEGRGLTVPRLDYPTEQYPAEELRKRATNTTDSWLAGLFTKLTEQPAALKALNR